MKLIKIELKTKRGPPMHRWRNRITERLYCVLLEKFLIFLYTLYVLHKCTNADLSCPACMFCELQTWNCLGQCRLQIMNVSESSYLRLPSLSLSMNISLYSSQAEQEIPYSRPGLA